MLPLFSASGVMLLFLLINIRHTTAAPNFGELLASSRPRSCVGKETKPFVIECPEADWEASVDEGRKSWNGCRKYEILTSGSYCITSKWPKTTRSFYLSKDVMCKLYSTSEICDPSRQVASLSWRGNCTNSVTCGRGSWKSRMGFEGPTSMMCMIKDPKDDVHL